MKIMLVYFDFLATQVEIISLRTIFMYNDVRDNYLMAEKTLHFTMSLQNKFKIFNEFIFYFEYRKCNTCPLQLQY